MWIMVVRFSLWVAVIAGWRFGIAWGVCALLVSALLLSIWTGVGIQQELDDLKREKAENSACPR